MMRNFGTLIKMTVFALGLLLFGLAPAAQALAENRHNNHNNRHGYSNHNYGNNYRRNHNRHNYNRYNNRYNYGYRRHNSGHGDTLALGLLTGGLLFYALTANQRSSSYDRRTVYVQQQPVYVQPPQSQWVQQRRPAQPQNLDSSCLQVREYQTTITVGNQSVPAYGQSCLQADGSWKLGPAIPEPGYQ